MAGKAYHEEPDEGFDDTLATAWFDEDDLDHDDPDVRLDLHLAAVADIAKEAGIDATAATQLLMVRDEVAAWKRLEDDLVAAGCGVWNSDTRFLVWPPGKLPPCPCESCDPPAVGECRGHRQLYPCPDCAEA